MRFGQRCSPLLYDELMKIESLDELEKLVRDLFSAVPVKPPPDNVFVSDKGYLDFF